MKWIELMIQYTGKQNGKWYLNMQFVSRKHNSYWSELYWNSRKYMELWSVKAFILNFLFQMFAEALIVDSINFHLFFCVKQRFRITHEYIVIYLCCWILIGDSIRKIALQSPSGTGSAGKDDKEVTLAWCNPTSKTPVRLWQTCEYNQK